MANLCDAFEIFHNRIALTAGTQTELATARAAVRDRIRSHFRTILKTPAPKFWSQGALPINTCINPISGDCHIQDGVYLEHLNKQDSAAWPSADTVHQWLAQAVQDWLVLGQVDDPSCVRLLNKSRFCLDLHCYAELNGRWMKAVKGEANWSAHQPLGINKWFRSYVNVRGEQLCRIVRFLKAWADFQSQHRGKIVDELVLTVLATYNFSYDYRDDLAFARTIEAISNYVRTIVYVINPVDIAEELSARLTDALKERLQEAVKDAANLANAAIIIDDTRKSSLLWRKIFGDRFPMIQHID